MRDISVKKATEAFTVMAKPAGSLCNLRCTYCYYLETDNGTKNSQQSVMTYEALEQYIKNYIESSPGPVIQFCWHGGEPALAGIGFYTRAVELQKKHLPAGWECWNNLQTNGTLLDDEWCRFLKENNFDVGISVDGYKALHDNFRKDAAGAPTFDKTAAAVKRLQAHGIQPDLLCTVTALAAENPLEVYTTLRSFGTRWIQFIPIVVLGENGNVSEDSVSGEAYGRFLCKIFNEWAYKDLGRVDVQMFAEAAIVSSGGSSNLCWMAPECGRVLIVEMDGGVYSCDHFVSAQYKIGNIEESSLAELVDLPVQKSFGLAKHDKLPGQCLKCPWLKFCNGGCPKDRFLISQDNQPNLNYLCEGFSSFFSYAHKALEKLMEIKSLGLSPLNIMEELKAEDDLRWKNIGRNDLCPCGSGRKAKQCCLPKRN